MVNWNLQPDEPVEAVEPEVQPDLTDTPEAEPEAPTFDNEAVLARIAALEQANKQAEAIAADIRRSVGRVQSLVDRIDKTSGEARTKLETELDARYLEMTGLLGEAVGSIDPAILPDTVRQRVNQAQTVAQQRAASAQVERLINERVAAAVPTPTTENEIPREWLVWEQAANKRITDAGLNPANFDWEYPNYLLYRGNMEAADKAIEAQINAAIPTKVSETKATQTGSPSAASGAAASKEWWEKLDDPRVSKEEKFKIMKQQKLI